MTDLDIQIDVPDDDDLGTSVRVLNNDGIPPWFKAAVVLLVGLLLLIMVAAFIVGRNRAADDEAPATTEAEKGDTPISSAEASPAMDMTLEAVEAWEQFAQTGNLEAIDGTFDPGGPQYALFAEQAAQDGVAAVDLDAQNLVRSDQGDITVVSMDLMVTDQDGNEEVLPYDAVYRPGENRVWTIVDRRQPGEVAVPPAQEVVDATAAGWDRFTRAIADDDGAAALAAVSGDTANLVEQLAAGGSAAGAETGLEDELEEVLLSRVRAATADEPAEALMAIIDADQRHGIVNGSLGSWTQTDADRVIATLEIDGEQITIVPFVTAADGWVFDLAAAMRATNGAEG
jgi:hypothetical protein